MNTGPNRILDDFAKLFTDAAGAAQGVRREVETALRGQAERLLNSMDVVQREEFEAVHLAQHRFQAFCQNGFVAVKKNSRHFLIPFRALAMFRDFRQESRIASESLRGFSNEICPMSTEN